MSALSSEDIDRFIEQGFIRVDRAFGRDLADTARARLWRDLGLDPDDPSAWARPVLRLGMYTDAPFVQAANTPRLHAAYDQLVGTGRWRAPGAVGTFPVRFPSLEDPGDAGWHIDASFGDDAPDFMQWRVNVSSRGRALLLLLLFSDVGETDAPTRIRSGSHADIARVLAPAGDAGLTLGQLAAVEFGRREDRAEALAVGEPGTAYLCHPFLVHSAQQHRGTRPRFMAQPPLLPAEPVSLNRADGRYSPVERAIRAAIDA